MFHNLQSYNKAVQREGCVTFRRILIFGEISDKLI